MQQLTFQKHFGEMIFNFKKEVKYMGYVIGIAIAISVLVMIAEGAPILFCVIIGAVAMAIAYFFWGVKKFDDIKRQIAVFDRRDRIENTIKANSSEIMKMKNSEFFRMIVDNIWNFNNLLSEDIISRQCTHSNKPIAKEDMLAYPSIVITNTKVSNGIGYGSNSSDILFSDMGFRDLDSKQIEILGMALASKSGYTYSENADEKGFSRIAVDWSYWKPRIDQKINSVYNTKVEEYNRTHKNIY